MNLIFDPWIPIRRNDGSRQHIAPWQLTDGIGDNPILAVASPRPDFDGALTQFLIGLLQTTCSPTEDQWWDWLESPPSSDDLKERFANWEKVFRLDGDGVRFMQERLREGAEPHPVSYLLIGAPTDNSEKNNIDHFQKRRPPGESLCRPCAAAAIYTLQTFAPSGGGGGDGKYTGLRGGGPLTSIMLGKTLWETIWLNVLHGATFSAKSPNTRTFPWIDPASFISEQHPVKTIHSAEMNPEHLFWGMPRRVWLDFAENQPPDTARHCSLCGEIDESMCVEYHDLTGGLSYQEKYAEQDKQGKDKESKRPSWLFPSHPLTPYTVNKKGEPLAVHPQPGGIGYRHWLGLVESSQEGDTKRMPAAILEQYRNSRFPGDGRLWAFGFEMDNMKAVCWHDATMPILNVPESCSALFSDLSGRMVRAANQVADDLAKHLKAALFSAKSKVRVDDLKFVKPHFWSLTEGGFYSALRQLRDTLESDLQAHSILEGWLNTLSATAYSLFDHYSQAGDFDSIEPRQIAMARNRLRAALTSDALTHKILCLPKPDKTSKMLRAAGANRRSK